MGQWHSKQAGRERHHIYGSRNQLLARDIDFKAAVYLVTAHNADLRRLADDMLPVSNDGNFVFIDGPGDVELDHGGVMRAALEAIASGTADPAAVARAALDRTGFQPDEVRPDTPSAS